MVNKVQSIEILKDLILTLYDSVNINNDLYNKIIEGIEYTNNLISNDRFKREIIILLNTYKISSEDRKENIKIAIISDLEKELSRIKKLSE